VFTTAYKQQKRRLPGIVLDFHQTPPYPASRLPRVLRPQCCGQGLVADGSPSLEDHHNI
jgi:hypothetical protein